jgi:hypothetical protein
MTGSNHDPIVAGNAIRILKDAKENYLAWLEAIAAAKSTIQFRNHAAYCVGLTSTITPSHPGTPDPKDRSHPDSGRCATTIDAQDDVVDDGHMVPAAVVGVNTQLAGRLRDAQRDRHSFASSTFERLAP